MCSDLRVTAVPFPLVFRAFDPSSCMAGKLLLQELGALCASGGYSLSLSTSHTMSPDFLIR
jgi:hypothetical protein